jgi:hypothetical protein
MAVDGAMACHPDAPILSNNKPSKLPRSESPSPASARLGSRVGIELTLQTYRERSRERCPSAGGLGCQSRQPDSDGGRSVDAASVRQPVGNPKFGEKREQGKQPLAR